MREGIVHIALNFFEEGRVLADVGEWQCAVEPIRRFLPIVPFATEPSIVLLDFGIKLI